MPVDPSLSLTAGTSGANVTVNPLKMMLDMAQLQQMGNQAKLFRQEYDARSALGPILQRTITTDPSSQDYGQLNIEKFTAEAAQDPRVAWKAQEIVKGALENRQTQIDNVGKQLTQSRDRLNLINQNLGSLSNLGDTVTRDNVIDVAGKLVSDGTIDARKMALMLKDMPNGGPALAQWVQQRQLAATEAAKQLDLKYGKWESYDVGNRHLIKQFDQLAGTVTTRAMLPKTLSPSEAATPVEGTDEEGTPFSISKGEFAERQKLAPPGTYTGAQATPLPKGLSPSESATQLGLGKNAEEYEKGVNEEVTISRNLLNRIEEIREGLKNARTGGGSELRVALAKFAQYGGLPTAWVDKMAGGDLGASEELKKLFVQTSVEVLKQSLAGAAGSRITNMEFEQFQKNNPNLETDPRAIEKINNFLTRISKMAMDQQQEMVKFRTSKAKGGEGKELKDWPAEWAKRAEARGYGVPKIVEGEAKSIESKPKPSLEEIFK